jgi:hypothetical protein
MLQNDEICWQFGLFTSVDLQRKYKASDAITRRIASCVKPQHNPANQQPKSKARAP